MKWGGWTYLIVVATIMIAASGCSSVLYDDEKFMDTWRDHIRNDDELMTQITGAFERSDMITAKEYLRQLSQISADDYSTVLEYQVSPDYQKSQYYFAQYLSAKVDCLNMYVSDIERTEKGDTANQGYYLELAHVKGRSADNSLQLAIDNLPV
ncbi:MAG: hypothetical protein A4E36_00221 [Methanoregulaceae archaeon PtaB.Bin009]|jgi:hypothetical protein|nr:MAG: hypothetical protein A4E36_00221 [Methanoregulaceae archaeon PtaB.Bin009]OPY43001.1 MAG: hypothetical protein A4E41_00038 [Methanoregulaceae archaeon PtaU1.Bin066]